MISKANHWARARHGGDRAQGEAEGDRELCYFVEDFLEDSEEGTRIFLNLGNSQHFHDVLTEVCDGHAPAGVEFYSSLQSSIKIKWPAENKGSGMYVALTLRPGKLIFRL